ncbi:MAG TPA: MFS transporter [Steroidobacteraceae bacterium]|nr:MFS transporter [Steroidobacteraceae bacterium]
MQEPRGTQTRGDNYMVVVLAAGYFLAFLDRQSLALFVIPIEHDLHLTDLQMGLLLGFAFGLLYALLGIPCGLLADRLNRRRLIITGIAFWSVATLVCALASNAAQLFVGRIGVGIGEATLAPAATSMITDAFPPWQRGRAFGVFSLGTTFGAGTASLLGAGVIALLVQAQVQLPLFGTLQAWQVTLVIVALAGLPIIVALARVREPPRRARTGAGALPLAAIAAHVVRHWRLYALIYLSNVLASLMSYAFYPWVPTAMERLWHVSRPSIGVHLGLMIIVLSSIGIYGSGWLVDRLNLRGRQHGLALLGTCVFLVLAAIAAVMFRLPHLGLTWTMVGLYILLVHIYFPFALLALSIVTPPGAMAALAAVNFMFTGILGLSLGPTLVVLVARTFPGPAGTAHAISAVCMGLALLGALSYALLLGPLRRFARPAA